MIFLRNKKKWFFLLGLLLLGPLIHFPFSISFLNSSFFGKKQAIQNDRLVAHLKENSEGKASRLRWFYEFSKSKGIPFFRHLGRSPSKREELQFGFLRGRYKLKFYDQRLMSIQFVPSSLEEGSKELQPLSYFDARQFIKKHSHFFPSGIDPEKASLQARQRTVDNKVYFLRNLFLF